MNYLEVTPKFWQVFRSEAPEFIRKRVDALVKAGFLTPAGGSGLRTTYAVTGGPNEYERGAELLISASL